MPIIDLTLPLASGMPVWPGDPAVRIAQHLTINADGVRVSRLELGTHAGTHIDAPAHLLAEGAGVDSIALETLCGPVLVLNLPKVPVISATTLQALTPDLDCKRMLLRTSNSILSRLHQATFHRDYVALDASAAAWLVARDVRLVGIDSLSVDVGESKDLPAHRVLLGNGVVIIEGLDLRLAPAGMHELICAPLPIQGADGAPARVFLRTH